MQVIPSPPGWTAHSDSGETGVVVAWQLDYDDPGTLVPMVVWPHQTVAWTITQALGPVRLVGPNL